MMRLSVFKLLAIVGFFALSFAALRTGTAGWIIFVQAVAVALLFGSIIAAIYSRAAGRASWIGFIILAWGTMLHPHTYLSQTFVGTDALANVLLDVLPDPLVVKKRKVGEVVFLRMSNSNELQGATITAANNDGSYNIEWNGAQGIGSWSPRASVLNRASLEQITSPLLTLFFGFVGAVIARVCYGTRDKPIAPITLAPSAVNATGNIPV